MNNIKNILEKIWDSHEVLRGEKVKKQLRSSMIYSGPYNDEISSDDKFTLVTCFFIESYYTGILSKRYDDLSDFFIDMHTGCVPNRGKIIELFDSLKEDIDDKLIYEALSIVYPYKWSDYSSQENENLLRDWMLDHLPLEYSLQLKGEFSRISVCEIFENTAEYLGVKSRKGTLLIRGDNTFLTKEVLSHSFLNWEGTYLFYPSSKRFWQIISLIITFFNKDNKFPCLKYSSDLKEVTPFDTKLNGIICFGPHFSTNNNCFLLNDVYNYVEENGFCLVFNQSVNWIPKFFETYNIPIIFENKDIKEKVYLCIKNEALSDSVRICDTETQDRKDSEYVIDSITTAIYEDSPSDDYQKLSKFDFLYAKDHNITFDNIKRPLDQIGFVFMKISDLIKVKTNRSKLYGNINDNKIVERYDLSSNPFNLNASESYYADKSIIQENGTDFYKGVKYKIRRNGFVDPEWPSEYINEYISIEKSNFPLSNNQIQFKNKLECRVCTKPTILLRRNQILKVNASFDKPLCYRAFAFWDDPQGFVGYEHIKEIEINPKYDESFVLYQLSQSYYMGGRYILSPPSKKTQHEYYLKKLDEYKLANADLIKLIRQETLKDMSSQIHNTKHVISNRLSGVNSNLSNIILEIEETDLDGKEAIIQDLNRAKDVASKVTDDLILFANLIEEKPTPENIFTFLNEYIHNIIKSKMFRIINEIDINLDGMLCLLYKSSIIMAFDNIMLNAERHAFKEKSNDNAMVISAKKHNNSVEIRFANNGTPPDSTLTEKGYFTDGITAGPCANSGHGGALVKKYVERNGGITHLILDDENYPFVVQIQIPFYYERN